MVQTHINAALWVNIDHVATLREARKTPYPDLAEAIAQAEAGGASGITMHLREDRRHVRDDDVRMARERVTTALNLEMAATDEMVAIAVATRPDECCIVPEKREELTTEGGLNVRAQLAQISDACRALKAAAIKVSLFVEADRRTLDDAAAVGADIVELHTGQYALCEGEAQQACLRRIADAAEYAAGLGLQVNAGHGLRRENVAPIAAITQMTALNIGHAVIADAVFMGLREATAAMYRAMQA